MTARILRADILRHDLNPRKLQTLLEFVRDYRRVAARLSYEQWRLFFEIGRTNPNHLDKSLNSLCGAAPLQMARRQVVEQIDSWLSNRSNDFRRLVEHSGLSPDIKRQLHTVNRLKAWFRRESITLRGADAPIPDHIRALARTIMRHAMAQHRRPDLSRVSPRLDNRILTGITRPVSASHANLWATLRLPNRGKIQVPLLTHHRFETRVGALCPVIQLVTEGRSLGFRLITDVTSDFTASRAAYRPRTPSVGIDFGLVTLMATSQGDLFGRGWLADLKRLDRQLVGIARHRMRAGEKPRDSLRYRDLVTRLRGTLRTRVNAALNRIVQIHAPAELVVERVDFSHPDLSRRLNRLLRNCGRSVFREKLADLEQRFGVVATEVNPAYTSRECGGCGYVDRRNRPTQSHFSCLWCGRTIHADVGAAQVINRRRSPASGLGHAGKGDILRTLVARHTERWPDITTRRHGQKGMPNDPRLTNPYFREWAAAARKLCETQEPAPDLIRGHGPFGLMQ